MRNWRSHGTSNEYYLANGIGSGDPHYTWGTLLCRIALENICAILPDGDIRLNGTLRAAAWLNNIPLAGHLYDLRVKPGNTFLLRRGKIILHARGQVLVEPLFTSQGNNHKSSAKSEETQEAAEVNGGDFNDQ